MAERRKRWLRPVAARINMGMTQEEAAAKLRINKYRLSRMEKGHIPWPANLLWDMAALYEVEVDEFKV